MTIRKINYTVIAPEVEEEIKDKYTKLELDNLLNEKSDKTHNHNLNDLSEKSYNSLDDIPTEFNPSQHIHTESEIIDLDKYTKDEVDNKLSQKQNNIGYTPENIANKGVANGYASLDSNGKIPLSQIPDATFNTYTYYQITPFDNWVIKHNLNRYPSVTIVDSSGNVVAGEVKYIDNNTINISFVGVFAGTAYLN